MLEWILAALAIFVLQTYMPATIQYVFGEGRRDENLKIALGGRDNPPPMPVLGARAARALRNMQEALFVFLPLAVIALVHDAGPWATRGAAIFVIARFVYVPAYLSAIPGLRSAVWMVSQVGLISLAYAVASSHGLLG